MTEHQFLLPPETVGRQHEWDSLVEFLESGADHATLGIVWGRRRIGKSYLLSELCEASGGLYFEAVRGSASEALRQLGAAVGEATGAPAPVALDDWETAISALIQIGERREVCVVLDEYPYLREESPELDSIIQRAFGPRSQLRTSTRCRLLLCGSAISVMSELLSGSAPLRGRAGLDLSVAPFDYRDALDLYGTDDLSVAMLLYSIIGGVAAYARDMVDDDVPATRAAFERWVPRRVLAPSAPLSREVELLLSEDPATSKARKINLYHAALAAIALGNHTPGRISNYVKISGPSLDPILNSLVSAQFVERTEDPVRAQRPAYRPGDPIIRFHYSVLRPNHARLSRHGADLPHLWKGLQPTFQSQVVGPAFESMARHWLTHYASIPGVTDAETYVGSTVVQIDNKAREVDVIVGRADGDTPAERTVAAIGEAKSGEEITVGHLDRLEAIRDTFKERGADATLLLVGTRFAKNLVARTTQRSDVQLVDLERLYYGS